TTIEYQLKESSFVCIEIYNIKGQRISTLVNETKKSGYHRIIWNGTDANGSILSAGVYLCKMMAGNYSSSMKMILMN
ncbi:MAG: FlgD immunoglobulin-like domain containing protein, partial [Candidatus Cloacimonadaceae bacterium]